MSPPTVDAWLPRPGRLVDSGVRGVRDRLRKLDSLDSTASTPTWTLGVLVLVVALLGGGLLLTSGMGLAQESGGSNVRTIESCKDINSTEQGQHYELGDDLENDDGRCLYVDDGVDDVTIDGRGHHIESGDDSGPVIEFHGDRLTLVNVSVDGGTHGIYGYQSTGSQIRDVEVGNADQHAIWLQEASDTVVENVTVFDSGEAGVRIEADETDTNNVSISGLTATGNRGGIRVLSGDGHTISDSTVYGNDGSENEGYEIEVRDATGTTAERVTIGDESEYGTTVDFSNARWVALDDISSPVASPENETAVDRYVHTDSLGSESSESELDLELHYDDEDARAVNESTLSLWRDGGDGSWTGVAGSSANTTTQTVAGDLQSFGTVGAFGAADAYFDVTVENATSPVLEGQNVDVDVTVTNDGQLPETQNVSLTVDGTENDSQPIELNASGSTSTTLVWSTETGDAGEHTVTVESDDESDTATVQVDRPANLTVDVLEYDDAAVAGEFLNVTTNVTNVGDRNASQELGLAVVDENGTEREVADESVSFEPGESRNVTLAWQTVEGDAGNYSVEFASENDSASADVRVLEQPDFQLSIANPAPEVLIGETVALDVTVENVGEATGTQNVSLAVLGADGSVADVVDGESLTLDGGNETDVTLEWATTADDRGQTDLSVTSDDDVENATATVNAPANLTVDVVEYDDTAVAGEPLNVTANVTNVGDLTASQALTLSVVGEDGTGREVANDSVSFEPGESRNVTLAWQTDRDEAGDYSVEFASENDSDGAEVSVLEPPNFAVTAVDAAPSVFENETLTVTATVENTGEATGEQTVALNASNERADATTVTLDGGNATTVSLDWAVDADATAGDLVRNYTVTVASEDDAAGTDVEVRDAQAHFVSITDVDSPVQQGEDLTVDATVDVHDGSGQPRTVTLRAAGSVRDRTNVSLSGTDSANVTLEWSDVEHEPGDVDVIVASEDDDATAQVTITEADDDDDGGLAPPDPDPAPEQTFSVSIDGTNSPVNVGGTARVTATVTNLDAERANGTVTLTTDGRTLDSTELSLGPEDRTTTRLRWQTGAGDLGTHEVSVGIGDASASEFVTVRDEPPAFDVTVDDTTSPVVERQPLVVNATIEADETDEQTVWLEDLDGETVDSETVALSAGESTTVSLVWTPQLGDAGSGYVRVGAAADSDVAEVTVRETPQFVVAVEGSNSPVEAGDALSVDARVTNLGDDERTGYLSLEAPADGTADDATVLEGRAITLDAGESRTVALAWQTEATDGGQYDLVVDVGADEDRVPVTIDDESGGLLGVGPEWTGSVVDYEPTEQTRHVGVFLWLTVIVGALAAYVLVTRATTDARLLGVTLLVAALRTGTDVLHASVGGITTEPLLALNTALELYVGLLFFLFAASYVGKSALLERRSVLGLAAVAVLGTATIAANPNGLVFSDVTLAEAPFTYVTADTGPLGWLILTATLAALLFAVGLLVQSFLEGTNPAWRPVGVLASGLCLALVFVVLSVFDRGPLPHYDYTGAGMAGFLLVTTTTLFGHGLQRIKHNAQRSLIEDLEDPIVIANDARVVVDYNAAAADLLPGIAIGERFDRLVASSPEWPAPGEATTAEESRSGLLPSRRATPSDATAIEAVNSEHGERDATADAEVHYLVRTTSVTADTADSIGYTVRFTDVTELKRRTNELARKNAQLEQVASTISHDLRNPLSVADGYIDLMEQSVPPAGSGQPVEPAALADHVGPVTRALERMNAIIDDILALARGGEEVSETEAVEFGDLVEEAWATVDTDEATLYVDSSGLIDADPRRLRRILENLFRNAVEHAGEDVAVVTGVTDDGFYVADDGPGIPAAEREAIFEEGYSSAADGTGLGLAIVTQLARAHDWEVELDPDYDGARFVFTGCTTLTERERPASGAPQQD